MVNSEYTLWGGRPHSFGKINLPSSQTTLFSRRRFEISKQALLISLVCYYICCKQRISTALALKYQSIALLISLVCYYICCKQRISTALALKYQSKLCLSRSFVTIFAKGRCRFL